MGKRRKTIRIENFVNVYNSLSINQRINFKFWWFCDGRARMNIIDIIQFFKNMGFCPSKELLEIQSEYGTFYIKP